MRKLKLFKPTLLLMLAGLLVFLLLPELAAQDKDDNYG